MLLHAFALAQRGKSRPLPTHLARSVAERLLLEARQCTLNEITAAIHSFGLLGIRDARTLAACSSSLPKLLEAATAESDEALAPLVARLCDGLVALNWPDEGALHFASTFLIKSLQRTTQPPSPVA